MTNKPQILIVDDEKPLRDMLAKWLSASYDCLTAPDAELALATIKQTPGISLMITDFKMPGDNGIELTKKAKLLSPDLAVIILTAHADINLVIEALRDGVDDFFQKPITDLNLFEERVNRLIEGLKIKRGNLEDENDLADSPKDNNIGSFIGQSASMQKVYNLIRKVAPSDANVLIEGPSGSGKELTARAIHDLSKRASGPFVAVECAAYSSTLLETELFGSVKGAYTDARDRAGCFETADGGTLFLDEIGEIDLTTQIKLLRVLETKTFQRVGEATNRSSNFRLVTATNKNLLKLVAEGKFKEDLYYRLHVIDIHTPALSEHKEDIKLLVDKFISEFAKMSEPMVTGITPSALKTLEDYNWPGNVRQLRNIIEKMVVLASSETLSDDDIPDEIRNPVPPISNVTRTTLDKSVATPKLADVEKQQILDALAACNNNKSKAATALGISRRTLHRKLNDWKIDL